MCQYPVTTFQKQAAKPAASDHFEYSQEMSGQPPYLKRQGARGPERTKGPEDQGTRRPRDQRTKGPADQGTIGPSHQRTRGPRDGPGFWAAEQKSTIATPLKKMFATPLQKKPGPPKADLT